MPATVVRCWYNYLFFVTSNLFRLLVSCYVRVSIRRDVSLHIGFHADTRTPNHLRYALTVMELTKELRTFYQSQNQSLRCDAVKLCKTVHTHTRRYISTHGSCVVSQWQSHLLPTYVQKYQAKLATPVTLGWGWHAAPTYLPGCSPRWAPRIYPA